MRRRGTRGTTTCYVLRFTCTWYVHLLRFAFTFAFNDSVHFEVLCFRVWLGSLAP